jgi:hypothetical protein
VSSAAALARRHALALLVLGLLALRLGTVLTSVERVAYDEELYRGTIAKELLEGPKASLWDYQADHYQGGSLVVGALAAPAFRVLGPSLAALKLVPLAFAAAVLVVLFAFLRRFFGERAAVAGGLLYVVAPPGPTYQSLIAMGFHTESVLFSGLMLLGWYGFVLGASDRTAWLGLFGLAAGAGLSFTPITGVTAVGCAASALGLRPRRPGPRETTALLVGLALGLLPWAAYNATHGLAGARFALSVFSPLAGADGSPVGILDRLARKTAAMGVFALPDSYGFRPVAGVPGRVLGYLYCLTIVGLVARALRRREIARRVLPLLFILGSFVLAYLFSQYAVPRAGEPGDLSRFHHLAPAQLVLLMLAAVAIALTRRPGAVLALFLVLGVAGQATMLFNEPPGRALRYRGYSYFYLGQLWQSRLLPRSELLPAAVARLDALAPSDRRMVVMGLLDGAVSSDPPTAAAHIPEADPGYRVYIAEAVGAAAGDRGGGAGEIDAATRVMSAEERDHFFRGYGAARVWRREGLGAYTRFVAGAEPRDRPHLHTSLGMFLASVCADAERARACEEAERVVAGLAPGERRWAYRGAGEVQGQRWLGSRTLHERRVGSHAVPEAYGDDFAWGIGWGVRQLFMGDRVRALDWIERMTAARRPAARAGLLACETWYGLEDGSAR